MVHNVNTESSFGIVFFIELSIHLFPQCLFSDVHFVLTSVKGLDYTGFLKENFSKRPLSETKL